MHGFTCVTLQNKKKLSMQDSINFRKNCLLTLFKWATYKLQLSFIKERDYHFSTAVYKNAYVTEV